MGSPMMCKSNVLTYFSFIFSSSKTFLFNMPAYKLTYFDGRARAETSRLLFALKGQKYTDVRIQHCDWPKLKAGLVHFYIL